MITDLNDALLRPYMTLKGDSLEKGYFIAESKKVVEKLINSNYQLISLLCSESFSNQNEFFLKGIEPLIVADELAAQITGKKFHKGVMAIGKLPNFLPVDQLNGPTLVLNGLTSPENVGAIMRNCAGFNVTNVLFDHKTCHPFLRRCIRVSMGNTFFLNFSKSQDLKFDLAVLKKSGYEIIGTANEPSSLELRAHQFNKNSAIIIGSEGHGMDDEIKECCNKLIKIPMMEKVQHLNAACASAVVLYEFSQTSNLL